MMLWRLIDKRARDAMKYKNSLNPNPDAPRLLSARHNFLFGDGEANAVALNTANISAAISPSTTALASYGCNM